MEFKTITNRISKPIFIFWTIYSILVTARIIVKPDEGMWIGMCFAGMGGWALIIFCIIKFFEKERFGDGLNKKIFLESNIYLRIVASYGCLILPVPFLIFSMFLLHLFSYFKFINILLFPFETFGMAGFFQIQAIAPYSGLHLKPPIEFFLVFIQWSLVVLLGYGISRKSSFVAHLSSFVFLSVGTILVVFFIFDLLGLEIPFATD